jgi:DNA polymerase III subunit epsilon
MRYAIVDIETTGGSPKSSKITEIAIFVHDGNAIVDEFTTLVNPETKIPAYITALTGISDEMVANAPSFYEIARKIIEITDGAIFVAHNVSFDYNFIRAEFKSLGYEYKRDTLCSVKLSRKLLPGHKSYSLGNLCSDLNIVVEGRHRAAGDALATTRLFEILLSHQKNIEPNGFTNNDYKDLNPLLNFEKVKQLPEECGVYYFHNEKGDILFVGKSRNIRNRVLSHLANTESKRAQKMRGEIASVSYELTGSELIALLLEIKKIKKYKPAYNRTYRQGGDNYGIYQYIDAKGFICLKIESLKNNTEIPVACFDREETAKGFLRQMVDKYHLCLKLCGLYESIWHCFNYEIGLCYGPCAGKESAKSYNTRAQYVIDHIFKFNSGYLIIDKGRLESERSAVLVENECYKGFGFFDISYASCQSEIIECIKKESDDSDARRIIKNFIARNKVEKIIAYPFDEKL